MRTNRIIVGDAIEEMNKLDAESIKMVFTSPPYNLLNSSGGGMNGNTKSLWPNAGLREGYDGHDDNMPHPEYVEWQRDCLSAMMRVLRPDGAIFYNHKWRMQNGLLQDRSDIVNGFPVRQILIWDRQGALNITPSCFNPTYEVIYMIAKPGYRVAQSSRGLGAVWRILPERHNPHPAPFPVALPSKAIRASWGHEDDIVLDPFMGSGTTAIAAEQSSMKWLGIEKSQEYANMANIRLVDHRKQARLAV